MKKNLIILLSLLSVNANAQTYSSQPAESISKDASLGYHDGFGTADNNYGTDIYFKAFCIPGASGGENTNRGLIQFDLSSIPSNAQVISATFNLYATGYINASLPGHFGGNSAKLFRVTSNWNESTVTWNTEPSYNVSDFVAVPASSSSTQDYSMNITSWTQDMVNNQIQNLGFLLKLDVEDPNNSAALTFHSSGASSASDRPSIEVEYVLGGDTLCFTTGVEVPDADASLGYHDNYATSGNNYSTDVYFKAFCLPGASGGQNTNRGLLRFDLSSIPTNAQVTSASLSLTATGYINANLPGHFGSNSGLLQLVTSNWSLGTVTWDNQPAITATGQISVPASSSSTQNYTIDVMDFVEGWVSAPSTNYGTLFRLVSENPSSSAALTFHSSNASNADDRPRLCVTYKDGDLEVTTLIAENFKLTLYPNPANGCFNVSTEGVNIQEVRVMDLSGRIIYDQLNNCESNTYRVSAIDWPKGCYLVTIVGDNNEIITQRIEIQ